MPSPSAKLTNEIIHEIYSAGGFAWRASSTGIYDTHRHLHRTAPKKGVADILAIYKGHFFAIEVKIGKDRQSEEQKGFQKNIEYYGGYYFIAKDLESFKLWYTEVIRTLS